MKSTFFKGIAVGCVVSSITLVSTFAFAGTGVGTAGPQTCSNGSAVASIKPNGTVKCTTSAVVPINQVPANTARVSTTLGASSLELTTECHTGGGTTVYFNNVGTTITSLTWMFSQGGTASTVDASRDLIPAGGFLGFTTALGKGLDGQWIAKESGHLITINLHSETGSSTCTTYGTAQVTAVS